MCCLVPVCLLSFLHCVELLYGPKVDLLFDAVANSWPNFRYQGRSVGKVGAWDMWDETEQAVIAGPFEGSVDWRTG